MTQLLTVRYPGAETVYELNERGTPEVGDVLERNGESWVVQAVTVEADGTSTVTLGPGLKSKPEPPIAEAS